MCSLLGVLQLILRSFSSASAQVNPTTMTFANFDNNIKQKQKKNMKLLLHQQDFFFF